MKLVSHLLGRVAVRPRKAEREASRFPKRGRSGALLLGLAAAAALAVPASASASTDASPVVGHVYINDNTAGTNGIARRRLTPSSLTFWRALPTTREWHRC